MSDTTTETNGVTSQYAAQVAGDLERNLKERERLAGEITVLQSRLDALEKDRTVLLNLQQALGAAPSPTAAETEPAAKAPAARGKAAAAADTATPAKSKKPAAAGKPADRQKTPRRSAAEPAQPSLVSLVREYLAAQKQPLSAADITQALAEQHPRRAIKTTVVRTTLEGLVAKSHAQRSKQGASVYYTSPSTPPPTENQAQDQPA
ncbi:hypothetical protein JCM4814A_78920 [Streptomyces phaeofaciens JCM 4814]|uniref:Regulatory protein n=1 Tax=Streptomyces phaeofaciens TaxID=68254 RepID=A0A918HSS1_9ACTN|nr:hypothetical protein [Streptomyces phaeofaciens]GGT96212.1 hypothetical protein GCM10010226_87290 [Streptomyces phaeofaciens]